MGQTADQLRQELDQKRRDLTRDVDRIEEKVKSTFDLNSQVQQNPLLATGLAVLGGFLVGNIVGGGEKSKDTASRDWQRSSSAPSYSAGGYAPSSSTYSQTTEHTSGRHEAHSGPSLIDGVKESFRRGSGGGNVEDMVSNMTAAITAMLVDKARDLLDSNLPGFADKYEQAVNTSRQRPSSYTGSGTTGAGGMSSSTGSTMSEADRPTGGYTGSSGYTGSPPSSSPLGASSPSPEGRQL